MKMQNEDENSYLNLWGYEARYFQQLNQSIKKLIRNLKAMQNKYPPGKKWYNFRKTTHYSTYSRAEDVVMNYLQFKKELYIKRRKRKMSPIQSLYFETLFQHSDEFKKRVKAIHEKYKISWYDDSTGNDNRSTLTLGKNVLETLKNQKYNSLHKAFDRDVRSLCKFFYIQEYFEEIRYYVLSGIQNLVRKYYVTFHRHGMNIELSYDATKGDFLKLWEAIDEDRKSEQVKEFRKGLAPRRKNISMKYFDAKIRLYKKRIEKEKISENEKRIIANIDKTQQSKWIKQVKDWIKELN